MDNKAKKCTFRIGYKDGMKGYKPSKLVSKNIGIVKMLSLERLNMFPT